MKQLVCVGLLLVSGCAAPRSVPPPPPPPIATLTEAKPMAEPPPQPVTTLTDATFIPADSPEIQEALQQYLKSGKAPVIEKKSAGFMVFPYGLSQPVLYCQFLKVCDIELELGEKVSGVPACGDCGNEEGGGRWVLQGFLSGPAERQTQHVLVKPKDWDITTNLVIGTDRRVYYIALVSRRDKYVRRLRFYYPEDVLKQLNTQQQATAKVEQSVVATLPHVSIEELDDRYQIEGHTAWRPTWVVNDGVHTYLKMPADLHTTDAPALFVETPNGENTLVNYRVRGRYYIVDKIFERAVLT
jgi:P-type conjugative transfer protein TrbG